MDNKKEAVIEFAIRVMSDVYEPNSLSTGRRIIFTATLAARPGRLDVPLYTMPSPPRPSILLLPLAFSSVWNVICVPSLRVATIGGRAACAGAGAGTGTGTGAGAGAAASAILFYTVILLGL